ncbi:sulfite exporter TauE/SafE family protein [Alphaproteobacteria bacterium]|nr:sulfite exporter TauE/SafE family protein [Alphaproteobacteria bacterium]MDA8544268.1 sulfite exporter TauE/SafE family protein [Alphaproteobacteria bacterium]MDA8623971.1 sulfite exporter TauE/SafE family protein [Alphaproteobacteria bacterium]MDA8667332.1 sulfite exporter TauE/SafE family protein [Alphaproteobacteria bacterium]MDA9590382.1 sulfite exporter TauE/SafE family protein [Alphaproteobacteria bacterium]
MTAFILPVLFFATAALYATVGFGGGSTYTALLVMMDDAIWRIPIIALICNITVVAAGSYLAVTRRAFVWQHAAPFFIASVPLAFMGGLIALRDETYITLLAISLLLAGLRLLLIRDKDIIASPTQSTGKAIAIGGALGLLSGMVGIGGGIFLAPILYYLRWADSKTIAALCSFFILVNSLAGLTGQLVKNGAGVIPEIAEVALPLMAATFLGGLLGARLLLEYLSPNKIQQITALLIIFVATRLLLQLYF